MQIHLRTVVTENSVRSENIEVPVVRAKRTVTNNLENEAVPG